MDAKGFASFFVEDGWFRFANAEAMRGLKAIEEGVAGFFVSINGLHHEFVGVWETGDAKIIHANVTYTRKDGGRITIPAVTIYRMRGDLAQSGQVFVDLSPLFKS